MSVLDLAFDAEQEMLRQSVRDLFAHACPTTVVREMEDDPVGFPDKLWRQMASLDLTGLLVPEAFGGSGRGLLDGVVLYEEIGRALVPVPHFVSTVMVAGLLVRAGTPEQQQRWLPGIATGDAVMTVAWLEPDRGFGPAGVAARAEARGDGWVLDGVKRHVAFAGAADAMVVLARTGPGADGVAAFVVPGDAPGVTRTQQRTIASDTQFRVDLADVVVPADHRIGGTKGTWAAWDATVADGIVLLAAQAAGGARRALELAVQYAKDRQQFGKPIGAFQAISHYLADAVTVVDGADHLVHEAAWARDEGRPEAATLAPMAKLFACRTFRDVTAMAQQVFGGMGFTLEVDVQLYFRRAKAMQLNWLDTAALERRVAAAVLDG